MNFCHKKHVICGFGNPLIDMYTVLQGGEVFEKFNLDPDGQKEVDSEEFNEILLFIKNKNYNILSSPGGCTQNTLRIMQALVKFPLFSVFFGGLGNDEEGEFLELEMKKYGLETKYTKHIKYSTGKVAALISGETRSLVANLGAAEVYKLEHFVTPENLKIIEESFIVYIEGFFIIHSFDVSLKIIELCKIHNVVVAFNISGAYVAECFPKELKTIAENADILIGNVGEFRALAELVNLKYESLEEMALKLHLTLWKEKSQSQFKLPQMNSFGRTLVITQGKEPVICVYGDKCLFKYDIPPLDTSLVKDSTGAGDAFAAGFLVNLLQGRSVTECVAYGCQVGRDVIQHVGVRVSSQMLL